ncbi:hypothetical protein BDB00DRAFT_825514 [Zychaea mexicana]|uniref:uncharacterized protein n=1 Tax=Zychaea mexicana TaxID=64656 RepID=UPI0022FE2FA5|nr:uncharacterized protein BDB00DRAFT_825514 [Zychaea mexicana]KAI9492976.1 hypothetical protein BDB00DRAFT_825514 [Zychaea mexicana]
MLVHEIGAANEHIKPIDTTEYIDSFFVPEVGMRLVREDLESAGESEEDCDCTISLAEEHSPLSNMALIHIERSVDYGCFKYFIFSNISLYTFI